MKTLYLCCYVLIISILQLVYSHHIPKSPCPGTFDYASDGSHTYFGVIRLKATAPVSYLVIRANYTIEETLTEKDFLGQIEAEDGDHLLAKYNQGTPVLFRVHFPRTKALPHLTSFTVNGFTLCQGPDVKPHHPETRPTKYRLQFISYFRGGESALPQWVTGDA